MPVALGRYGVMAGYVTAPNRSCRVSAVLLMSILAVWSVSGGSARADVPDALRAYQRGDFEAAAAELMPFAEKGDPRAQFAIGRMCFYGQVLAQDARAAAAWYRRAAEQGYAPAQLAYGIALDGGWGVARDPEQAMRWYRLAALQGEANAMWRLAYHYRRGVGAPRDFVEAWAWFDRLADAGDSRAAVERDWLGLAGLDEATMLRARERSAALARELEAAPMMAELDHFWGESHWPGYDPGIAAAQNGDWDRARREWQTRAREGDVGARVSASPKFMSMAAASAAIRCWPSTGSRWPPAAAMSARNSSLPSSMRRARGLRTIRSRRWPGFSSPCRGSNPASSGWKHARRSLRSAPA